MTIKDMPHVTVEQVFAMREAAIKLEEQNHQLKTRLRAMQKCAKESQCENWTAWLNDKDISILSDMDKLWLYAHAYRSDVLGEE